MNPDAAPRDQLIQQAHALAQQWGWACKRIGQRHTFLSRDAMFAASIARLIALLVLLAASIGCAQTPSEGDTAAGKGTVSAGQPGRTQDATAAAAWAGQYEFADRAGQTVGGTGVVTTYRLEVPKAASTPGTLQIVGFQADRTLRCELSATRAELSVRFLSYADGRAVNEFGVAVYEPHQVLFTLRRGPDDSRLTTTWKALRPDGVR